MEKNKRKPRRTKLSLEKDFMDAVKNVIEKDGFSRTTLAAITGRADITPNVFYNRYNSMDELFEEYVKRYDYWLSDISDANVDPDDVDNHAELFEKILVGLTASLYQNKSMQQILIWELEEENEITTRSALLREANTAALVDSFDETYKAINKDLDIRVVASLFISGIYYLILHKNMSTFCTIDFSKKEGKTLLLKTISQLTKMLFGEDVKAETFRIATNMKLKGMDVETIAEVTGLTEEEVMGI